MNAVIYARLDRYERNEELLQERIERCNTWAQAMNIKVVKVFSDKSCSGATLDRPAFTKMCEFVLKRQAQVIIVSEQLQLSSNPKDGELLADVFDDLRIEIHSVAEGRINPQRLMQPRPENYRQVAGSLRARGVRVAR